MSTNLTASVQDRGGVDRGGVDRGNPSERSTQFVPVDGGTSQASDAGTFMVAAYVLMWLCAVFFILHTWRKTRSVEARMIELQRAIAKVPQTED